MQIYGEINALAPFQKQTLIKKLSETDKTISNISGEYLHFIDYEKLLGEQEDILKKLLTYDQKFDGARRGELFLVIPRPGTISPWSSKATDIAINSGLQNIRRIERGLAYYIESSGPIDRQKIEPLLYDRMTEVVLNDIEKAQILFEDHSPKPYQQVDILSGGKKVLDKANTDFGLALSSDEIDYLFESYNQIKRNPSDVELMMFAQVNSEHCRHKIFNATWTIDGNKQPKSLFKMIKNTHEKNSNDILSAYKDNAAVLRGPKVDKFKPDIKSNLYEYSEVSANLVIKAETHNHPTAIAPFPGAASGISGEIRDEAATGRGGRSKMGFSGYTVSNLFIPGSIQPWEKNYKKPERISSPLDIMIEAPLGGAAYANEFGRPCLGGYFRTFENDFNGNQWGYHKPLMICGGLGNIESEQIEKLDLKPGNLLIVLGGPGMVVGVGGGAGSSVQAGQSNEDLDFASVQRDNAEMQRRAQEVINSCVSYGDKNPIRAIHDIGAGGLSNGFPELVHGSGLGANFELRNIHNADSGMSPLEIWCNEIQDRFVLGIDASDLQKFTEICQRERCLFSVVGKATEEKQLIVSDKLFKNNPIDIPMDLLFGNPPKMTKAISSKREVVSRKSFDFSQIKLGEAIERVLHMPSVGSKKFLITIADRTVGGMSVRDQMVGPWQVPVSDVAITASSFDGISGEALAIGERPPLALINAPASGRMAIGEALTNIVASQIDKLSDIKLSANWMAANGFKQEDRNLYDTVKAVGEDFCPELGLTIPVGKDSLNMRTTWSDKGIEKSVTSPLSLVISAFAPVSDTKKTLTPQLQPDLTSVLIAIDLGKGKNRMAGSALAQAYGQIGDETPDIDAETLKHFFSTIQKLNQQNKILAYHDRSDGGLLATLLEMCFASRLGLDITANSMSELFNEELGAVIQVAEKNAKGILDIFSDNAKIIAEINKSQNIALSCGSETLEYTRAKLESMWAETSYQIQKLRDNPESAEQEFELINDNNDPGITPKYNISHSKTTESSAKRPKVAIFREQGINGQVEMAAAFDRAGFDAIDVHLSDLSSGKRDLGEFSVLAVCGGFSYGDVLGAGEGWAKSILFNDKLRQQFKQFFERQDTLSLGVCNGCQMLSALKELIPGSDHWPRFLQNRSGRYEARLVSVKINDSKSILFNGMAGSILPVPTAHGEGRAVFESTSELEYSLKNNLVCGQYVDNYGKVTDQYPLNPNGSEQGITSLTSQDGRATIIMPHPERVFLTKQLSYHPIDWPDESPWFKIFQNARDWIG